MYRQGLISSIFSASKLEPPKLTLKLLMTGPTEEILCLDSDTTLHICAASSSDGTTHLFDLRNGAFLLSLNYNRTSRSDNNTNNKDTDQSDSSFADAVRVISYVKILSCKKQVVSYCRQQRVLYLHSVDGGELVAWKKVDWMERMDCWTITRDGKYLIGGGKEGSLALFSVDSNRFYLQDSLKSSSKVEVTSLALAEERKTEFLWWAMPMASSRYSHSVRNNNNDLMKATLKSGIVYIT